MVRLLHLSDIHFRPEVAGELRDVDTAVRTDLLADLQDFMTDDGPAVDAIVVVGDIAATAAPSEYDRAREFLDEVAELVRCPRSSVVCVPGNHDVDRTQLTPLNRGLQRLLRTEVPRRAGTVLKQILDEADAAEVLYRPFGNYNSFAEPLGCSMTARHPLWAAKDISLGNHVLRLRGVNSAITCDGSEADEVLERRLVLGDVQLTPLVEDRDVVSILLCHHPLSWIRDTDSVAGWLARPHVLLTGHVHEMGITSRPDGRSVIIAAGAVNPDPRYDEWVPAYNVIDIAVDETPNLVLDVFVRCYGKDRTGFAPDPRFGNPERLSVPLSRAFVQPIGPDFETQQPDPEPLNSEAHGLIFSILTASPDARERTARAMGLLGADERIDGLGAERSLIAKLRQTNQLLEFTETMKSA